ncbi:hypothetical protein [Rhizobium sp. P007]|uniref:hypothetical protein n=1 Tax=Rhizobium phage RR1-A TaxID=929833 RepID=UPI0003425CF3|nr:hypothetical protein [Rhizobium sp. P007]YP_008130154.1 hypothetical protein RHXG_00007 [Rhizobium phage RR1-A]AGN34383.1 hypothetical protein RHXG_00007 [Rhizobium phage RR1-A]CAD7058658.1 hypothetical protein RP007_02663 [Rhizobium sp. P007]
MFARFKKPFELADTSVGKVTYPRGWAGELDDKTYAAAKKAGVLLLAIDSGKAIDNAKAASDENGAASKIKAANASVKKAEEDAKSARTKADADISKAQQEVSDAEVAAAKQIEKIHASVAIHQKIADAKVAIIAAGTDTVAKDKADAELKAAETELAELQA